MDRANALCRAGTRARRTGALRQGIRRFRRDVHQAAPGALRIRARGAGGGGQCPPGNGRHRPPPETEARSEAGDAPVDRARVAGTPGRDALRRQRLDGAAARFRRVEHGARMTPARRTAQRFDPLHLTDMANAFAMIAEEMGTVLVRGALSPNIRERRDASSALFDAEGRMVAQAAHIPVHLGAMPESVRAVRACKPAAGDVFILNDPYDGGSHLPDLTIVQAIAAAGKIVGYAAVRAHHADVGGMSPG